MPASDAPPAAAQPTAKPTGTPPRQRRSIARWFLRLLFRGKRAIVTAPFVLLGLYVGWESMVYWWYRGASDGERTGIIVKISRKGSPLCRYESVEMKVGQQVGAAVLNADTWEFTVDPAYQWLIPQLQEAERKQQPITVKYRQDSDEKDGKPTPPPKNLPWRFCVTTSYHATGLIAGK